MENIERMRKKLDSFTIYRIEMGPPPETSILSEAARNEFAELGGLPPALEAFTENLSRPKTRVPAKPFSEQQVAELEQEFGPLPGEFRWFLLNYGECEIELENSDRCLVFAKKWYLGSFVSADTLTSFPRDAFPNKVLPFSDTTMGDCYCISLREDTWGQIFFWGHGLPGDPSDDQHFENTMQLTCSTFAEMILSLELEEDES